jgi:hypothetical protein
MSSSEVTMLSAQVPASLRDDLHQLARQHDRSVSAEVRAALRTHVLLSQVPVETAGEALSAVAPTEPRKERRAPDTPAVEAQAPGGEGN